jgi:glucose-6-phosphate 1-epimerase
MQIKGLEGSTHLDKLVEDAPAETQADIVVLNPAKDSVYLNQTGTVSLVDADNNREIIIQKRNSPATVKVDEERLAYWKSVGAQMSEKVKKLTSK